MLKKIIDNYRLKKAMIKEAHLNRSHFDNAFVEWSAPLRYKPEKGPVWLFIVATLLGLILYYAITTENWFFGIAMVIAAVAYAVDYFEETPMIEIKISSVGLKVGKKVIPYANIKGFWMYFHPPFVSRIYIRTGQKTMPDLVIELNGTDPALVRKYLTRYVDEWEEKHESFMDIFVRLFKL